MSYQTGAGAALLVSSAAPATFDSSGYGALTGTVVGEVTNIGDFFGREYAEVTHNPLANRATQYGKGSYNNGTISPAMALDPADAGQTILTAALNSDSPIAVGIRLQDGSEYWCMALVMSFMPNVGGVDDVVTASSTLRATKDWIKVAA